ncbi:unnamed protein product [Cercopithifilaria johnstoni]|uniref:Protein Wnt n=1 Tax=Cercopithifilaria johnstoni TaxID=2874296 RepID=A0A8J2PSN2_9BILA|nr:unnamed protein product [Cercopithifilaria johnstoni]
MCRRISDLMPVIIRASQTTVSTCQKVFADHRWNCSSILRAPLYKSDLTKVKLILRNPFSFCFNYRLILCKYYSMISTKEQAFVHALSSAALTHHVAKACVSGDLPYCPCGLNSPTVSADTSYKWKGCSDNVLYGQKVSREWADASWRKKWRPSNITVPSRRRYRELINDWAYINTEFSERKSSIDLSPRARMNEHNNEVGRQVTQESLYRKCKCHGVSSSCNVRTCWNTLPDVYDIALKLRERYAEAALLLESEYADKAMHGELSRQHLVYLRDSPDYCVEDNNTGSYGTTMRECNLTSSGPSSCSSLCCGRGYYTNKTPVEEQCQCKYVHCCYVKCKTCKYLFDKHHCK